MSPYVTSSLQINLHVFSEGKFASCVVCVFDIEIFLSAWHFVAETERNETR